MILLVIRAEADSSRRWTVWVEASFPFRSSSGSRSRLLNKGISRFCKNFPSSFNSILRFFLSNSGTPSSASSLCMAWERASWAICVFGSLGHMLILGRYQKKYRNCSNSMLYLFICCQILSIFIISKSRKMSNGHAGAFGL